MGTTSEYDPHEQACRLAQVVGRMLVVRSIDDGRVFVAGEEYPVHGCEPVEVLATYDKGSKR